MGEIIRQESTPADLHDLTTDEVDHQLVETYHGMTDVFEVPIDTIVRQGVDVFAGVIDVKAEQILHPDITVDNFVEAFEHFHGRSINDTEKVVFEPLTNLLNEYRVRHGGDKPFPHALHRLPRVDAA